MIQIKRNIVFAVVAISASTAFAQDGLRASSSRYLQCNKKADVYVPFAISAEGVRYTPTWGMDQAWMDEHIMLKGINHMGKENIGIGRSAYRFTKPLTNDSVLSSEVINMINQRNRIFNKVSASLPLVLTADQEAGTDEYFVKNKSADVDHWAAMINSHVHYLQEKTKHPVVGVSPFNEPDYWTVEEGATPEKQVQVAKILKEKYPRFADVAIVGGNTLNDDKALEWYTSGKQYYDWGNTHQLAGSFDNFAGFFQQLVKDGKMGYADEMHNVGEAMIGLKYGMTVGIWWGFDSRARGEFCQISRNGCELAYGEHRNNWTAASVYRHNDGRVKAFIGSSERQAKTTTYQFLSTERDVYYDGYGPIREFMMEIPGGTAYQVGQTNAERVINVTWGENVPPCVINGTYKLVNKVSGAKGNVVAYKSLESPTITQEKYSDKTTQKWVVKPCDSRVGGDYSFYSISSVTDSKIHMNVRDFSMLSNAEVMAYKQDSYSSNELWYLEYAGDGYYYIRNRESSLYLASASTATTANIVQSSMLTGTNRDRLLFRFIPVDVEYDTQSPSQPIGMQAIGQAASVRLNWTANSEDDLEGYIVVRKEKETDDWNVIARQLTEPIFVDNTCRPHHTYIYKVKAIDRSQNISEGSDSVEASPLNEPALIARWNFEDNLYDDTPNMMDMGANSTVKYVTDTIAGSKCLSLPNQFVQLPYEIASSDEFTFAAWVNWRSTSATWQRIFDFGNDTNHYMFLTPYNNYTNKLRFAIKNGGEEQVLDCSSKLQGLKWKHVVLTIGKDTTRIYVDGELAAETTGITIKPSDIRPSLNYLGRSQFNTDSNISAYYDDVRIYNYALSADEVKKVMTGAMPTGIKSVDASGVAKNKVYSIDGKRLDRPRSGLNVINNRKVIVR